MKKLLRIAAFALVALSLGGCNIYKKYQLPVEQSEIVENYSKALESPVDSTSLPMLGWEKVFTDPLLQGYIREALNNNTNLENARLNVDIARAQLQGAKLSYFPAVSLNPNVGTSSYGGSDMKLSYTIPLAISWEIDAFGKILNRKRGAKASVEQVEAYEQAVQSQIVCGVASTYYSLVLLKQQLELTKQTAVIWKDQVQTMVDMKEAAMTTEASVVQSRANYYSILSSIPDIEAGIVTAQNALALLLNSYPREFEVTSDLTFDLPVELRNGVPVSYLAARPDVRAMERSLAAAYYATNSARAAFYPSIMISSNGGFTNLLGSIIKNPGEWFIQLAGSLTAPLFSRGQNIATLKAAKAQQKQALNNFEYSVLSASSDVSNALCAIEKNAVKREMILQQVDQLEKSVEYTNDLFMLNRGTYLELLTARTQLLNSQLSSLACWHSRVAALISLYQAVGGGR
ncbi:MAG: TolC family protein [Bacteroides sp.]|nr:TolC family protein [Bacteroides sp.]MBD5336834.1 TolC family protein [Bacteroides sp.]